MYIPKWLIAILVAICLIAGLSAVWVYANSVFWLVAGGLVIASACAAVIYFIILNTVATVAAELLTGFLSVFLNRR